MIQEVLVLIQSQLNENRIVVRAELNNGLPSVFGDRIQLQQVVLNLIVNAIDAIGAAQADPREIRIIDFSADSPQIGQIHLSRLANLEQHLQKLQ